MHQVTDLVAWTHGPNYAGPRMPEPILAVQPGGSKHIESTPPPAPTPQPPTRLMPTCLLTQPLPLHTTPPDVYSTAYKFPLVDANIMDQPETGFPMIEVPLDGTQYDLLTGKVGSGWRTADMAWVH